MEVTAEKIAHRKQVIQRELAWHEEQSHRRYHLDEFLYDAPAFDEVVQPAIAFLRSAGGDIVLEMGCGEGKDTLELAAQGFTVIGADLSTTQLQRARQLLEEKMPGARAIFIQANAEALPFKESSFRAVYGKAILHHLDLEISANEAKRVLASGGRATFAEPLAEHPLFWLGRRLTPALRTQDERPLTLAEFEQFGTTFQKRSVQTYFLLAPLAYVLKLFPNENSAFGVIHQFLNRVDQWLFSRISRLRQSAWYAAVWLQK